LHRSADGGRCVPNSGNLLAPSHARPIRPANSACASKTIPRSLRRSNEARNTLQRCPSVSIYVEILVRAPMDALWSHTQTPALYRRWDLRFSRIEYLPRNGESEPQRFQYATRIGLGLEVSGQGETVGRRDSTDGSSTSTFQGRLCFRERNGG